MDKAARDSEKTLKRLQGTARAMAGAFAAAFAGVSIGQGIGAIIRNTTEAEEALAQLTARIKSTGGVAGVTADQLTEFASSLSEVTTFGDDAIVSMQSLLLSFTNIRGQQVFGATEAILDLATAMKTDLQSAAMQVGKALNDPVKGISALGRAGVQFTDDQEKLIKALVRTGDVAGAQTIILKELETQFGGSARAAANTFGGSITQLQNAFGDLLEADGGLSDATGAVKEFTALLREESTVQAAQTLTNGLIRGFAGVTEAAANTVNVVRFLAEELAALQFGAAAGDVARLQEELDKFMEIRARGGSSRFRFFGKDGFVEYYDDAELDREIARLKKQIEEATTGARPLLSPVPTPTTPGGGGPSILPESEEFLKVSEQLQKQVALYGKVTEVAKIRYEIEKGELQDLNDLEKEKLIGYAQQLDALNATAEAAKRQAEEMKRFQTELDASIKEGIEAQELEALKALEAESDRYFDTLDRGREITESMRTPQERYRDSILELNDLLRVGAIEQETYARAVEAAQAEVIDAVKTADDQWDVFRDQAARNTQDILADTLVNGFKDGADGVLKAFGQMLVQMAAQAVAADIAGKLFGNSSSGGTDTGWLGALFSAVGGFAGGFATGGTMMPGEWGVVGERGPEIAYAGSTPLNIQPMNMKSVNLTLNQTIQAPNERAGRQTAQQAGAAASQAIALASRRNN
jgi:hypothetical protein